MKKIVGVLLTIIIILAMFIPNVKAASFKFVVTPSATEVESGQTITISLKVSDINVGEEGINTVKTTFKYDETLFESVNVTSKNNWSITYNDQKNSEKYGTLLAVLVNKGATTNQEIGTITLKVKANSQGKTGKITFTNVSSNDGQNTIPETDKTISIKVKGEANSGNNANNNQNNGNGNTQDGNTQNGNGSNQNGSGNGSSNQNGSGNGNGSTSGTNNSQSSANSNKNSILVQTENVSTGKLPQTGINETILVVGVIIAALAIILGYVKYKKYKELK